MDLDKELTFATEQICKVFSHAQRWQTITEATKALQNVFLKYESLEVERSKNAQQLGNMQQTTGSNQQQRAYQGPLLNKID